MSMPKPEKNPLHDLYELIEKGNITKEITYRQKKYTFRSLNDEDYNWRDQFVNTTNYMSMMTSQRAPTLAIATIAIDGVPVEQMDLTEDNPLADATYMIPHNLYKNVYSKLSRGYLVGLYNLYLKEIEEPAQTITEEDVKKS
jgi:hypothetical protein